MEELYALIEIVNRQKIRRIDIIEYDQSKEGNQCQRLYTYLTERKFKDSAEAAKHFFPTHDIKKQKIYFSNLKSRLIKRLINTIFFIDQKNNNFSPFQKAYYNCIRNENAVKILIGRSQRKTAIKLAEKTLKQAIKYEITDTIIYLSRTLKKHYGGTTGNKLKYQKYKSLLASFQETQSAEILAEEYLSEIRLELAKSTAQNVHLAERAKTFLNNLKRIDKKHGSFTFKMYFFQLSRLRYELTNDHKQTIKVCREALNYFQKRTRISSPNLRFSFNFKILTSLVHLAEHHQIQLVAEQCLKMTEEGTRNWFATLHFAIISAFHSKDFILAYKIFERVESQSNFNKVYGNISEHWQIFKAYIHYFTLLEKIDLQLQAERFRVGKFLNSVPIYSQDKRGSNIPILILHILILLYQKKYAEIIDRVESIKMYAHRYLRKDDTFRSNCFIKMLIQLPANSFHKAAVVRKTQEYQKKLLEHKTGPMGINPEVEIVPYEYLWECVLESLDNKHHNIRRR